MNYRGYYINLDRSLERRAAVEAELRRHHAESRYERFPAVDGQSCSITNNKLGPGPAGCFLSHAKLLEQNLANPAHLHIVEDDVLYSPYAADLLDMVITNKTLSQFDLLFTDVYVPLSLETIRLYKDLYDRCMLPGASGERAFKEFRVVDLAAVNFASMASYLVNKDSISKLSELYRGHIEAGMTIPIDLFVRNLVHKGTLKAGCLFPFVTSVEPDTLVHMGASRRPQEKLSVLVSFLLRYSFYVGCDWSRCFSLLPPGSICEDEDVHKKLILSVLKARLFGNWQLF